MRVILLMLAVMVAGCVPSQEPSVRIGYNNWPGYELLWLAEELGYFRDAGVRVEHVQFMSLGDSRRAYERGQLDAVGVTAIELLQIPLNSQRQAVAGSGSLGDGCFSWWGSADCTGFHSSPAGSQG